MAPRSKISDEALEQFADAVRSLGLEFFAASPGDAAGADAYLVVPGENPVPLELKPSSLLSTKGLPEMLQKWNSLTTGDGAIRVVVADRITGDARDLLRNAGWGWLDLRGHLRLAANGLLVDTDVATHRADSRRTSEPFAGSVGIEVAAAMLLDPHQKIGIRRVAKQIGRAASSVSDAVAALRGANLLTKNDQPRIPELFWDLASAWKPKHRDVASLPQNDQGLLESLQVNIGGFESIGWALSDARAAAAYGAPVAIRSTHPPDFYVPDDRVLRRAVQLLGPAEERASRAATLRVAPTRIICANRQDPVKYESNRNSEYWPMAQPLFVALDLAQDPGRGREMLNDWTPPEPWPRVW
jgi:hypothetical protein